MSEPINVAIIGSGGREHALAWRMSQSPTLGKLFALPGNPGIAKIAQCASVPIGNHAAVARFCLDNEVGLVVVGPEDPLAAGITDDLTKAGLHVFGPKRAAARLEADKSYAKEVMGRASVPTAEAKTFSDPALAAAWVERHGAPCVVKAAGLAKGKGVSVCFRESDAIEAIEACMRKGAFGEAGRTVVIEEYLEGVECSVLALVDRRDLFVLELCQDHKPVGEGNTGPMTGGMGTFSPARTVTPQVLREIEADVFVPTLDALARDGVEFRGCLYAGLMITAGGPKVLEFNVRFGDPETQPLMMRWKGDLVAVLLAVAQGRLAEVVDSIGWDERTALCVVLASAGYPARYTTGAEITGVERAAEMADVQVFHGGTAIREGRLITNGGRVLGVSALGMGLREARERAYTAVKRIHFDGMHYRGDIGERLPGVVT